MIIKSHLRAKRRTIVFCTAVVASMPLLSNWLGSAATYLCYVLGIASALALTHELKYRFAPRELPIVMFFAAYLLSVTYAVNPDYTRDLLYVPVLIASYMGGRAIARARVATMLFDYIALLFIPFAVYLIAQLAEVEFRYNEYYAYSDSENKVDYLTAALYAGIVLIYAALGMERGWLRVVAGGLSLIVVAVSGARYSIIVVSLFLLALIVSRFRSHGRSLVVFSAIGGAFVAIFLYSGQGGSAWLANIESLLDFSIMRLMAFDDQEGSVITRVNLLQGSLRRIGDEPLFGYGINSSPLVIDYVHPHNMFLQAWLDAGLAAAAALLLIIIMSLIISLRLLKDSRLRYIALVNFYIILAHLKSFSVLHGIALFLVTGIVLTYHTGLVRK